MDFNFIHYGIGFGDLALLGNRVLLGTFFAISGFHKLFNAERHQALVQTFKENHIRFIGFNQWWVPSVEFFGGLALISGILAPLAACGLLVICAVATCTAGVKRIKEFNPIDKADWIDDLLYLPEVLYIKMLLIVLTLGPGHLTAWDLMNTLN